MAGGVDTTDRKPRRLRGTPAVKFSNRFAAVVIGFGVATGLLLNYLPIVEDIQKKFQIDLLTISKEEQERRGHFSFVKRSTKGEEVLRLLEEKEKYDKGM